VEVFGQEGRWKSRVDGAWWSFLETVRARVVVEFRVEDEENETEEGGRGKGDRDGVEPFSLIAALGVSPLVHIARFRLEGFFPPTRGYNTRIPSPSVTRVTRQYVTLRSACVT